MGYAACEDAMQHNKALSGSIGAGIGATVGKIYGMERSSKSGLGVCALEVRPVVDVAIFDKRFGMPERTPVTAGDADAGVSRVADFKLVQGVEVAVERNARSADIGDAAVHECDVGAAERKAVPIVVFK